MRTANIGHTGLLIESAAGGILCDPWFSPACLGSWVPFPNNEAIDISKTASPDCLCIFQEGYDAEESNSDELRSIGDSVIQRRCAHLNDELARVGLVESSVLTRSMHGWRLDVETSECLTPNDRRLCTLLATPGQGRSEA